MTNVEITKEEFTKLYYELSIRALAEKLGVTSSQICKNAKLLNLSKPRGKYPNCTKLIVRD